MTSPIPFPARYQSLDAQLNAERRVFVKDGKESGRGVQEIDICFLLDCTYVKRNARGGGGEGERAGAVAKGLFARAR